MMFTQITIIGMGLIGSSLARVISREGIADRLIAVDADEDVCAAVDTLGLADEVTSDAAQGVKGSDLVILATPSGALGAISKAIAPTLLPKAVVTDVASVKQAAIDAVSPNLPDSVDFVPAHPIAGTEHSGPEAGFAELFKERWCLITPAGETSVRAVEAVTKFWEACGAKIEIMAPDYHDQVLAMTSHLPHLLSFALVGTATTLEDDLKEEVIKYSASGFRSSTRLAASDPTMWRDICLDNREAILDALERFSNDLTAMQKAVRRGDGDFLHERFSKTRAIRRAIVELGPEGYPNPQRMAIEEQDEG